MPIPSIRVLPNPSFVCDHEGNPSCAIPLPDDGQSFIGAVRVFVPQGGEVPGHPGTQIGVYRFTFDTETPVIIYGATSIATVARHVRDGELLPADEASAKACGVSWRVPKNTKQSATQPTAGG